VGKEDQEKIFKRLKRVFDYYVGKAEKEVIERVKEEEGCELLEDLPDFYHERLPELLTCPQK
jgi:hypothetical protein